MSRVGKYPVTVPSGVTVALQDGVVVAKGKLGELRLPVVTDAVEVKIEDGSVTVSPKAGQREASDSTSMSRPCGPRVLAMSKSTPRSSSAISADLPSSQ